jgi:hypothetical protein
VNKLAALVQKGGADIGEPVHLGVAGASSRGSAKIGRYSSARTLEDYWYAWKSGGFATLQPKSGGDEGSGANC